MIDILMNNNDSETVIISFYATRERFLHGHSVVIARLDSLDITSPSDTLLTILVISSS